MEDYVITGLVIGGEGKNIGFSCCIFDTILKTFSDPQAVYMEDMSIHKHYCNDADFDYNEEWTVMVGGMW